MTDNLTAAQYRAMAAKEGQDKRRVRGTKRTTTPDGITHDSKREAARWTELLQLQAAGEITDLERQVPIDLLGRNAPIMTDSGKRVRAYVADFRYFDIRLGAWVIEDAKGHATDIYKLKRAILAAQGVPIVEV